MPVRNGVLTNRLATIRAVGTHHAIRLVRVLASQSLERWSGSGSRRPRDNGKPFTKHVRLHLPRTRSGHEGVHDAVQPAWNDSGAVFEQTAEALRYALLDAHRFHRHGLRIEAELFEHRCVRGRISPEKQWTSWRTG